MRRIYLITFGDAAHIAAAEALCPASALPETWTRIVQGDLPGDADAGDIVAYPQPIAGSGDTGLTPALNVRPHAVNAPGSVSARVYPRLITVAARSAQGNEAGTSYGPGLTLTVDTTPVAPANAQSWATLWAPVYLAWAEHEHGSLSAAHASLISAARSAASGAPWTEDVGYGVLPAYVLPEPGALVSTQALTWALYGSPSGASITPMELDGRSGVRIVAGAGTDRMRARAAVGGAYDPGRLYRLRTYTRNLSGADTAHLVARASEAPFGLAPSAYVDADVWEMQAAEITSGYDPSWQLRSGIAEDVPGAVLDVFVADTYVDTYAATGEVTPVAIADPEPVAPYGVTATEQAAGVYLVEWITVYPESAACIVSVDGVDVATSTTGAAAVYVSAGEHVVRVRLVTGETEDHSAVTVTSAADYVPPAPVPVAERDGADVVVTWPDVAGATSYRATVAPGVGEDPTLAVDPATSPLRVEWPGVAVVAVTAIGPGGDASDAGYAYALPEAAAKAVPLW